MRSILPAEVDGNLALLYRHAVELFAARSASAGVARFARLAIDAGLPEGLPQAKAALHDLWQRLFDAEAALTRWDEAYAALVAMPAGETRRICLRQLVASMCERGEVDRLLRYPFVGMQHLLVHTLQFRANNLDPRQSPSYHTILYAYFIHRGDYRSGAWSEIRRG